MEFTIRLDTLNVSYRRPFTQVMLYGCRAGERRAASRVIEACTVSKLNDSR